ncbi:MAG: hypothetical protein RR603_05300 [Kurthia sp.]
MKIYNYEVPAVLQHTEPLLVELEGESIGTVKRVYSNPIKRVIDSTLDYKYFAKIESEIDGFPKAVCKKIQRKGKIYFEAKEDGAPIYRIAYTGWKALIPEVVISNGETMLRVDMDRELGSTFTYNEEVVAKWHTSFDDTRNVFIAKFEVEEDCPIKNPALLLSIAQAVLFIGA